MSTPLGNIKGYDLRDRIGAGGFGAVYRAYQTTVGREVAIKIILPGLANQPDFIRRFESEAQLVARLEHPHITPLYDYWRDPEGAYLVMRWLRGGSLRDALEKGPFELRAAAGVIDQIAGALSLAHRSGVIHRDIKPGNILLDEDGNAYLTDFGIAKDLNLNSGGHTQPDAIIGSLDYISPEQARSEPVTPRTDIYSLGVTLYEMITGHHPFQNMSSVERLYKHINDPLPDISTLEAGVQAAVNRVIHKATAKDPDQRYPDALAFAADFREAVGIGRTSATLEELLTQREQDILRLIIEGRSNKEIAQDLTITLGTVKWYVNQIYSKMGVRSRVQAIVRARELNLIGRDGDSDSAIQPVPTEEFQPENPYKGLRAFTAADHKDFFGREKLVEKLLRRMAETGEYSRFLAVVGPSGGGKSSVVKAGLIPAIWRGTLPGSEKWFVAEMLPGAQPLDELEIALIKIANQHAGSIREQLERDANGLLRVAQLILPDDGSDLLLAIDQFEETYTLTEDETARQHFLDLLVAAVTAPRSRVRVVITLRADFYDRPLHDPHFGDLLRSRLETILPLSAEELELAIVRPAASVGAAFEPGLVTTIVADVKYQPGALPLLQYALTELFEARQGRLLSREAYQRIGGISGALARRAEELYTSLPPADASAAQQMFLRLVTLGEGVEDTRRRVPRAELLAVAADPEQMEEVLDTFAAYRLLSFDNDPGTRASTVEVAHEAILREWERLREWLNASRSDIQMQRQMAGMAAEWKAARGDASFLARGSRLEQFEAWMTDTTLALTPDERAFLSASSAERDRQAAAEREQQARETRLERRSQTFLRGLVVVLALAVVIAAGLISVALNNASEAQTARDNTQLALATSDANFRRAEQGRLASRAQNAFVKGESGNVIAALALRSLRYGYSEEADEALLSASGAGIIIQQLIGHRNAIYASRYSSDGTLIVTASIDGTARIWDANTGETLQVLPAGDESGIVDRAVFSPDDTRVVTAAANGTVRLWDVQTGTKLREWKLNDRIDRLVFSPDGLKIFAIGLAISAVYDVQATAEEEPFMPEEGAFVANILFSAGKAEWVIINAENAIRFQDIATGAARCDLIGHSDSIWLVVVTPDGLHIVSGGADGRALVWDTTTCKQITAFEGHTGAEIFLITFTADGKTVFSQDSNRWVYGWTLENGDIVQKLHVAGGGDRDMAVSPDSRRLLITGLPTARVYSLDFPTEPRKFNTTLSLGPWYAEFSPDGNTIFLGGPTNVQRLSLTTGEVLQTYVVDPEIRGFAVSPDGQFLFVGTDPSREAATSYPLYLLDVESGSVLRQFDGHTGLTNVLAYSPDSSMAASSSFDSTVRLWKLKTGEALHIWTDHTDATTYVDFSPDGQKVVSAGVDGFVYVWDVVSGAKLATFKHATGVVTSVFSPDGLRVMTGDTGGAGHVWDVVTGQEILTLNGHTDLIWDADYSPDGRLIATGSFDQSVRLWDSVTGQMMRIIRGSVGSFNGVAFSADGSELLAANGSVSGSLYKTHIQDVIDLFCAQLPGDLDAETLALYDLVASPDPCQF